MAIRVLVIGQHGSVEESGGDVADRVGPDTDTFITLRCGAPGDLVDLVRGAVRKLDAPISVLDLSDHGGAGYLRMGDPIEPPLFAAGIGAEIAMELAPFLTHDASVRLLGCDTALGAEGRDLLLTLRDAFNQKEKKSIVVYGALTSVAAEDFDVGGFKLEREEHYLFSSTEAAALLPDQVPPTLDERAFALYHWRRAVG